MIASDSVLFGPVPWDNDLNESHVVGNLVRRLERLGDAVELKHKAA